MRQRPLLALALLVALAAPGAALAHPHVVTADPLAGTAIAPGATGLSITFSEPVILRFTGVTVRDAAGHGVPTSAPALDPANNRRVIVTLARPLGSGAYVVAWRAVGADTHRVQGTYGFTVR